MPDADEPEEPVQRRVTASVFDLLSALARAGGSLASYRAVAEAIGQHNSVAKGSSRRPTAPVWWPSRPDRGTRPSSDCSATPNAAGGRRGRRIEAPGQMTAADDSRGADDARTYGGLL